MDNAFKNKIDVIKYLFKSLFLAAKLLYNLFLCLSKLRLWVYLTDSRFGYLWMNKVIWAITNQIPIENIKDRNGKQEKT